jgi:multidrug efflux pump subunit AcrB
MDRFRARWSAWPGAFIIHTHSLLWWLYRCHLSGFAITIASAVTLSVQVALTFTPHCAMLLKPRAGVRGKTGLSAGSSRAFDRSVNRCIGAGGQYVSSARRLPTDLRRLLLLLPYFFTPRLPSAFLPDGIRKNVCPGSGSPAGSPPKRASHRYHAQIP